MILSHHPSHSWWRRFVVVAVARPAVLLLLAGGGGGGGGGGGWFLPTTRIGRGAINAADAAPVKDEEGASSSYSKASYVPGTPTGGKVVALNKSNFDTALADHAANPLWLLKFYAPWCGHCKKLAPVLDEVAATVDGKMSVATVDCTQEKKLCQDYNVRGYPTLKFSLDGQVHDYPGGRGKSEFVSFAHKLSRSAIEEVGSVDDLNAALAKSDDGVAFVAYHPKVDGDTLTAKLQSTLLTQIFTQVARKEIAYGAFYLITDATVAAAALGDGSTNDGDQPRVCRIEAGVATRCYDRLEHVELDDLHKFVQANNVPTVAKLGPNNFHKVGRRGRPLLIGVVDLDRPEQVQVAKQQLAAYALDGPEDVRSKYYYAYMDGKSFQRFLIQFDVLVDDLPQLLLMDVPTRNYHQNSTYRLNVEDFVSAVQAGSIPRKNASKKGLEGVMRKLYYAIVQYRPWSVIMLVLVVFAIAVVILSLVFPPERKDPLRPPYKPDEVPADPSPAKAKGADESKKDK